MKDKLSYNGSRSMFKIIHKNCPEIRQINLHFSYCTGKIFFYDISGHFLFCLRDLPIIIFRHLLHFEWYSFSTIDHKERKQRLVARLLLSKPFWDKNKTRIPFS